MTPDMQIKNVNFISHIEASFSALANSSGLLINKLIIIILINKIINKLINTFSICVYSYCKSPHPWEQAA